MTGAGFLAAVNISAPCVGTRGQSVILSSMTTTRKNRQTGTPITVASAWECCADETDRDARWFTICETHGDNIAHATKRQAHWFAASPLDWCGGCIETAEGAA